MRVAARTALAAVCVWAFATPAVADGLQDEAFLHPLDAFTAQTLRAGEVFLAQPISPLPGWAQVGVTDWLTVEIDLTAIVGGLIESPHVPVPSTDVRWRVRDGFALEGMVQYLSAELAQEDLEHLVVRRQGLGGFLHANASIEVARHLWLHASAGVSYQNWFEVESQRRTIEHGATFEHLISPDVSLAFDWRVREWLSLNATGSYGATFVYSDNQPRKVQLAYGARVAPFLWTHVGILHDLRVELAAVVMYRPDAREVAALYLPILPYVYWQFML